MEAILLEKDLAPRYVGRRMAKADFLKWEPDDAFVYEFNYGLLEPTRSMKQTEVYVLRNLEDVFFQTESFLNGGRLLAEVDCWLTEEQMRRPDAAYYSDEQIRAMALGEAAIPTFVVELISEHDEILKGERKRSEYFAAGVRVVWWVLPPERTVYVYTSAKMAEICSGPDALHAAPALPDLHLTAEALFRF